MGEDRRGWEKIGEDRIGTGLGHSQGSLEK